MSVSRNYAPPFLPRLRSEVFWWTIRSGSGRADCRQLPSLSCTGCTYRRTIIEAHAHPDLRSSFNNNSEFNLTSVYHVGPRAHVLFLESCLHSGCSLRVCTWYTQILCHCDGYGVPTRGSACALFTLKDVQGLVHLMVWIEVSMISAVHAEPQDRQQECFHPSWIWGGSFGGEQVQHKLDTLESSGGSNVARHLLHRVSRPHCRSRNKALSFANFFSGCQSH